MIEISKAALAAEIGVHRSQVTRYVDKGLPLQENGKLNRAAALKWIADNCSGVGGGWLVRKDGPDVSERALAALGGPQLNLTPRELDIAVKVYEAIRSRLHRLPGIILQANRNLAPLWLLISVVEGFDCVLGKFAGEVHLELISEKQGRVKEPNYLELFQSHGIACTKRDLQKWRQQADKFIESFDRVLFGAGGDHE